MFELPIIISVRVVITAVMQVTTRNRQDPERQYGQQRDGFHSPSFLLVRPRTLMKIRLRHFLSYPLLVRRLR